MFKAIIKYIYTKRTGGPPRLDWYMTDATRNACIVAGANIGYALVSAENAIADGEEPHTDVWDTVDAALQELQDAALADEWRGDPYFRPAIKTRLAAYLKVDGVEKRDIEKILTMLRV